MAFLFDDAESDAFRVNSTPVTAAPMTWCCWFQTDDVTDDGTLLWMGDKDAEDQYWFIQVRGTVSGDPLDLNASDGGGQTITTTTGVSANTWHHVAAVFTASDDRDIYLDAAGKASGTADHAPSGVDRFSIGVLDRASPVSYHTGLIAEVSVWNVALTLAEITWLSKGFSALTLVHRLRSLVIYHDLIRDSNHPYIGADMTAVNTPAISAHCPIRYAGLQSLILKGTPSLFVPHTTII
jgi:hypothetical protein